MQGLPIQFVLFERRNISGTWRVVVHGDKVAAGVTYLNENTFRIICRADYPSFYLVFAQCQTGHASTRIELKRPLSGVINARREWNAFSFPQINSVTAPADGLTVNVPFTVLSRNYQPYHHAGAFWLIETTTENQEIEIEFASGVPIATNPIILGFWKLHNANEALTQGPNVFALPLSLQSGGGLSGFANYTFARIFDSESYFSTVLEAHRYRVTSVGGNGALRFETWPEFGGRPNEVCADYTHDFIVKLSSHAGETQTGSVFVELWRVGAGSATVAAWLNYGPAEAVYTFAIPAGARIDFARISTVATDRFEVEVMLNVTN